MYSGVVAPFAGFSFGYVHSHNGNIYCCDDGFLYRLQDMFWVPMIKTDGADNVHVDDSGIWLEFLDARPPYSRLVDEQGRTLRTEAYAPSRAVRIEEELFFRSSDEEQQLRKGLPDGSIEASRFSRLYEAPVSTLGKILIETRDGIVRCLATDFSEFWSLPPRQRSRGHLKQRPQVHAKSGNLFVNFEMNPEAGTYRSLALSATNGQILWELSFPQEPSFANLIGDKIYVACGGWLTVYNFVDGSELVRGPLPGSLSTLRWLCPHDGSLFVGGVSGNTGGGKTDFCIYVVDETTLQVTQQFPVPAEVSSSKPKSEFMQFGDLVVAPVWSPSLDSPYAATVVFSKSSKSESQDGVLPLPAKPDFRIAKLENPKGETEYMVSVSHANLDELWVWSAWVLKDLALSLGHATVIDKKSFDKKHNGVIHYAADLSVLDDSAETKLQDMLAAVEHSLRFVKPGMKKNSFKFQFMKVS